MTNRREQFNRIYEKEFDYVWNSLRRLDIPERDLEDVSHEVFVKVYENLKKALEVVEKHAKKFPNGDLAEERRVLKIRILHRLGRTDLARQKAEAFLENNPDSIFRDSLVNILDSSD